MLLLPKARTENLIEQNLDRETLLYDLITNKAFNLNETSSVVYKACDGKHSFEELKRKHQFTDDFIFLALDELKKHNLLADEYFSPFANTSRREIIKKVGLATMVALPIITGIVAPTAANAQSRGSSGSNNPPAGYGAACQNQSNCSVGGCVITAGGQDACCLIGSGPIVLPGGSYDTGENAPVYSLRDRDAPRNDPNGCQNLIMCCDGSAPSGSCTYTPVSDVEFEGKLLVRSDCNCSCA